MPGLEGQCAIKEILNHIASGRRGKNTAMCATCTVPGCVDYNGDPIVASIDPIYKMEDIDIRQSGVGFCRMGLSGRNISTDSQQF